MGHVIVMYGSNIGNIWVTYGSSGSCMDHTWVVYESCMGQAWHQLELDAEPETVYPSQNTIEQGPGSNPGHFLNNLYSLWIVVHCGSFWCCQLILFIHQFCSSSFEVCASLPNGYCQQEVHLLLGTVLCQPLGFLKVKVIQG